MSDNINELQEDIVKRLYNFAKKHPMKATTVAGSAFAGIASFCFYYYKRDVETTRTDLQYNQAAMKQELHYNMAAMKSEIQNFQLKVEAKLESKQAAMETRLQRNLKDFLGDQLKVFKDQASINISKLQLEMQQELFKLKKFGQMSTTKVDDTLTFMVPSDDNNVAFVIGNVKVSKVIVQPNGSSKTVATLKTSTLSKELRDKISSKEITAQDMDELFKNY